MTEYFKKINLQGAALSFELCIDHSKYSPLAYHISTVSPGWRDIQDHY